jgi:hypothetical protein
MLRWGPLALLLLLAACADDDLRYGSPLATYQTYVEGVVAQDTLAVWDCFSHSMRESEYGADYANWQKRWSAEIGDLTRAARRRQIAEEGPINDRIAFLRFDPTTLASSRVTPFFYFIRDSDGWKITSYLDSTFHAELERAIAEGEFTIPGY